MRRHLAIAAATAGLFLFACSASALAAPGYPPTTTTTPGAQIVANGSTITVPTSGTATIECPPGTFAGGATVQIFVNGALSGTTTANGDGSVTLGIVITDPHVSINGGPAVAVSGSSFALSLSGPGPSGGTANWAITVLIPAQFQTTAATSSTSSGSSLAVTGLDIAGMVAAAVVLIAAGTTLVIVTRRRTAGGSRASGS
jgi:hypothetical protein